MSRIVDLQSAVVTRLQSKASLRGVAIISLDALDYWEVYGNRLSELYGMVVSIGNPSGNNEASNVPGGYFGATLRAYVVENPRITRGRTLANTVADQAARLALTGISAGQRVFQTDVSKSFWLITAGGEAVASNWGEVLTVTQVLELVIRSLQCWKPDDHQTFVAARFEPGDANALADYIVNLTIKIGLDSSDPA